MNKIRTAQELYNEILKSFYFGVYNKGERLMTYKEAHDRYGLAKDTIGAAYAKLQEDGFVYTNRRCGTIITFDVNDPAHVAKVPLEWPQSGQKNAELHEITVRLHANALYTGLTRSNEEQLMECERLTAKILQRIEEELPHREQELALWMCIISSLNNDFLYRITEHYSSKYLYLLPACRLSPGQWSVLRFHTLNFYNYLLEALKNRAFMEFPARFWQYYRNYYEEGGVVFSKLEDGTLFKEQVLYGKLMDEICVKIMSGDLKKGDMLPTTVQLCAEYGVSKTTVNRTYNILMEMGIIKRRARSGTKLVAGPEDPAIHDTLGKAAGLYQRDWKDAVEALIILNDTLSKCVVISSEEIEQMHMELLRQRKLFVSYGTPFLVSSILISPLIEALPTGILHRYYFYLMDALNRIMTVFTFFIREDNEHGEEVYQLIRGALHALESGEQALFVVLTERVMRRNVELLQEDFTFN